MSTDADILAGDLPVSKGDSAIIKTHVRRTPLRIYSAGLLTVVGFAPEAHAEGTDVAESRDDIFQLIEEEKCAVIAFDLSGVPGIPSGLLGLLMSLHRRGLEVELYNPSDEVRDALTVTGLRPEFRIRDITVD